MRLPSSAIYESCARWPTPAERRCWRHSRPFPCGGLRPWFPVTWTAPAPAACTRPASAASTTAARFTSSAPLTARPACAKYWCWQTTWSSTAAASGNASNPWSRPPVRIGHSCSSVCGSTPNTPREPCRFTTPVRRARASGFPCHSWMKARWKGSAGYIFTPFASRIFHRSSAPWMLSRKNSVICWGAWNGSTLAAATTSPARATSSMS